MTRDFVFLRPLGPPTLAKEFLEIDADVFWAQLGLINEEAYNLLKEKGYTVIMDRCIKVEYAKSDRSHVVL